MAKINPKTARAMYEATIDRKSTRLNSSHGYISYAVFCLKKKKQTKTNKQKNKQKKKKKNTYTDTTQQSKTLDH